tara:strand:- start:1728 stop:2318 length:591 start_codon:yes stop_codon:yes gene_type:complete
MEGEDLILADLTKNITKGFYVDVGCYHPLHLNNTYLLYKKNWNGINIDISEFSIKLFNYLRPDDVNINSAISSSDEEINFYYQKKLSQLSTIKKEISKQRMQGKIKEKKIKSYKLNSILNSSKFKDRQIDFLNIDIEGADFDALKSLDFDIYNPKIICIEIMDKNVSTSKIYNFLKNLNYKKVWSSKSNFNHIFIK